MGPYTIGQLCAKYQLCAIRTADNTDGKSRKSIVSEKSPSFRPALIIRPQAQPQASHMIIKCHIHESGFTSGYLIKEFNNKKYELSSVTRKQNSGSV